MSLFDFFKKGGIGNIRPFYSDAGDFSIEQIGGWMDLSAEDTRFLPPARSDEYVRELIDRISNENGISIELDECKHDVRVVMLSIERNGSDYVYLSYQMFNPNVVCVTTAPYPFAGDKLTFLEYSNRFQHLFPMIAIGCSNYEDSLNSPMFSVRTCVPLLGYKKDFDNLVTATRSLPIYAYDLRDGYHSNNTQPYASRKTGYNIQLDKLINIYKLKSSKDLYPAFIALYGHASFTSVSIDVPASLSNPYLQHLNYRSGPDKMYGGSVSDEILFFHTEINRNTNCLERSDFTQLVCYTDYPGLYTLEDNQFVKFDDNKTYCDLLEIASSFGLPVIPDNAHELGLFKMSIIPYKTNDDTYLIKRAVTNCIPNEVNALALAKQIVDFQRACTASDELLEAIGINKKKK